MRLLHVKTFTIVEIPEADIPSYVILSHTWGEDEVTLQDMQDLSSARLKRGFEKVVRLCVQAEQDGWDWAWIDTCCIDKTSSSELSEAINSMYRWYASAITCYAYLCDVSSEDELRGIPEGETDSPSSSPPSEDWNLDENRAATQPPRWFTRGWTLQELLAPIEIVFYGSGWTPLGTKEDLKDLISSLTGIPTEILTHQALVSSVTVADRLYWASSRTTSRKEDMAYCLMGLFDINMPLLYGEGSRAFERLIEQILNSTADQTLFIGRSLPILAPWSEASEIMNYVPRSWEEMHDAMIGSDLKSFSVPCLYRPVYSNRSHNPQVSAREYGLRLSMLLKQLSEDDLRQIKEFRELPLMNSNIYLAVLDCVLKTEAVTDPPGQAATRFPGRVTESSEPRVAMFLQRVTDSAVSTTTPSFIRLRPFVFMVPSQSLDDWNFSTFYIVPPPNNLASFGPIIDILISSSFGYKIDVRSAATGYNLGFAAGFSLTLHGDEQRSDNPDVRGSVFGVVLARDKEITCVLQEFRDPKELFEKWADDEWIGEDQTEEWYNRWVSRLVRKIEDQPREHFNWKPFQKRASVIYQAKCLVQGSIQTSVSVRHIHLDKGWTFQFLVNIFEKGGNTQTASGTLTTGQDIGGRTQQKPRRYVLHQVLSARRDRSSAASVDRPRAYYIYTDYIQTVS